MCEKQGTRPCCTLCLVVKLVSRVNKQNSDEKYRWRWKCSPGWDFWGCFSRIIRFFSPANREQRLSGPGRAVGLISGSIWSSMGAEGRWTLLASPRQRGAKTEQTLRIIKYIGQRRKRLPQGVTEATNIYSCMFTFIRKAKKKTWPPTQRAILTVIKTVESHQSAWTEQRGGSAKQQRQLKNIIHQTNEVWVTGRRASAAGGPERYGSDTLFPLSPQCIGGRAQETADVEEQEITISRPCKCESCCLFH